MTYLHRFTRPAGEFHDRADVSTMLTNGLGYVSLIVADETAPRRERVKLSLTPDEACELAAALLASAANVAAGLHGSSPNLLDGDSVDGRAREAAAAALADWIARRTHEEQLADLRELFAAREIEDASIIDAQGGSL